jgi:hypothetical protein
MLRLQALDPTDKDHALRALARVTTAPLISRTLQYALSPAVRTQDVAKLLVDIAKQGGLGFNMTWEFIINHSGDIMKKYGGEQLRDGCQQQLSLCDGDAIHRFCMPALSSAVGYAGSTCSANVGFVVAGSSSSALIV